jgi:hypothetical protein
MLTTKKEKADDKKDSLQVIAKSAAEIPPNTTIGPVPIRSIIDRASYAVRSVFPTSNSSHLS